MNTFKQTALLSIAIFSIANTSKTFAQSAQKFNANLKEVTVFRKGAELTQTAQISVPAGVSEIVIQNVASSLDENSIRLATPPAMTIMSVVMQQDEADVDEENKSTEYLRRESALKDAKMELDKINNKILVYNNTLNLLEANRTVGGSQSGLSVLELGKLTDYYINKQNEIRNNILLQVELKEKQSQLVSKLEAQLGKLNWNNSGQNTGGQLKVQIMATTASQGEIRFSYLTNNAGWNGAYDLKADKINQPINLIYKANVYQNTGLDWNKTNLVLSTGNPSQGSNLPELNTWFLNYWKRPLYEYSQPSITSNSVRAKKTETGAQQGNEDAYKDATVGDYVAVTENAVVTNFKIDLPYTILSNNKAHAVALNSYKINAEFNYFAVPRLDPEAFLSATVTDFEQLNLVPGPANIIFDNQYIVKFTLNPYTSSDTLKLSMGRDKRINIKREKIIDQSGEKIIGMNKKQTLMYEISVKNNKSEDLELTLQDQYPIATDKSMEVELLKSDNATIDTEKGVLTWKIKLKAGASTKLRFGFSVKYPKDEKLGNL